MTQPISTPPGAATLPVSAWEVRSEKIQALHRDRLAIVYVRQSTVQQVHAHQESTRLQYGLTTRAQHLGWTAERVVVIDDDLGKSGTSTEGRVGFQRLVSEVSLDHVGIILGVEMSRLARSGKDWQQLLEICALFGTLLADLDGVYDPGQYNDRLLLGLKGTMSEAELHILQQRLHQGRLNKAQRGEFVISLPMGYVRRASGEVQFDPDEQVQEVVRLVFRKFEELGTLNGVLRYVTRHDLQVGVRLPGGPNKGDLVWRRPNRQMLQNLLKHPIYAGAYAFGRRSVEPRRKQPGRPYTGRVVRSRAEWQVLLPERVPAYITWDQYERNLARLRANQAGAETVGAARSGSALLAGLLVCGRCGGRLSVRYEGPRNRAGYVCAWAAANYGDARCQSLAGPPLDRFVTQQVLVALEPAALELSLAAAQNLERERVELTRLWQQRRERAAYEAERAARQYRLIEPEHRLVARQLERDWEEKLAIQQQLEEDYHRFEREQPRLLTPAEQAAIRRLAADIPALWDAPSTTAVDRKEIVRQVVERVIVTAVDATEQVLVTIEWVDGTRTEGRLSRPVARVDQLSYYPQLCQRLATLAAEGLSARAIAERLNAEGYRPPKRRECFGPQGVQDLLRRLDLVPPHPRSATRPELGKHEWEVLELARHLAMPEITLYSWIGRGWVSARRQEQPPHRWILWADAAEVERLRGRRRRPPGDDARQRWLADHPLLPTDPAASRP